MGFGGYFKGESYDHKSFAEEFFPWPEQEEQLLAKVAEHVEKADIYICPLLRTKRSRKAGTGALGRFAWADIDGQTPADGSAAAGAVELRHRIGARAAR